MFNETVVLVPNAASSISISNITFISGPFVFLAAFDVLPPPKNDESPPKPKPAPNISLNISDASKSSNPENPPAAPPKPPIWSNAAWPNLSYLSLFSLSDNTEYASCTSLIFSAASFSLETSGWYFLAYFLNALLISASVAV